MRNIKKLLTIFLMIIFTMPITKAVTYKDYGDIATLEEKYSYSTIFLSEETEFKIIKSAGDLTYQDAANKKIPTFANLKEGNEVIMLITKCAVNKNGELLDVLVKINNIEGYEGQSDYKINFSIVPSIRMPKSQSKPDEFNTIQLQINQPIILGFGTTTAQADFTMTYYKSGTYNEKTGKGIYGNIEDVNGFFGDMDSRGSFPDALFQGNEGVKPNLGNSIIYYNKNKKTSEGYSVELQEIDNGIAQKAKYSLTTDPGEAWYGTSAFITTSNLTNSTYSFTYGGRGCGIPFMFMSPYPYQVGSETNPLKKANVDYIVPGQEFNYYVSQYIPNNFYGESLGFHEIYNNLASSTRFTKLVITDNINENLTIDTKNIKVIDEVNDDYTNNFIIKVTGNKVEATAKTNLFNEANFYTHTYSLVIPVTLKEVELKSVKNKGTTTYAFGGLGDESKDTKEIELPVKYKLTVNYFEEGTDKKIIDSEVSYYSLKEKYETNIDKIDKNLWEMTSNSNNINGEINKNTEVNYYFKRKKYKITVNYLEEGTNTKIKDSEVYYYEYEDEYEIKNSEIDSNLWELVKSPEETKGTITDDIELNYYYKQVIIENPKTGSIIISISTVIAVITLIVIYLKNKRNKLYKI